MKRVRKAVTAGVLAAGTAVVVGLKTEVPTTNDGWVALIGGALVAGVLTGWATYRVPNAPDVPAGTYMRDGR